MSDPITIDWETNPDGGWKADIHVLWFTYDDQTLTVAWEGDWMTEHCESFPHAKRKAIEIARKILTDALEGVNESKP